MFFARSTRATDGPTGALSLSHLGHHDDGHPDDRDQDGDHHRRRVPRAYAPTGTSDSILAKVSNGEFVVKAAQTAKNLPLLKAINDGAPGFAEGGLALAAGGPLPLPACVSPHSQLNQLRQVLS